MSGAAETLSPTTQPSRSGRLLAVVRKLIDYGRELAATIRQRAATDPGFVRTAFGTIDLAAILACISRGLHRADALEARVLRSAPRLDAGPRPGASRSAPRSPAPAPDAPSAANVAHLPTPAQIAAEVRRRPLGAVVADICRDLGILPCHPLWQEVQRAVREHGGSPARLLSDLLNRAFPLTDPPPAAPATRRQPTLLVGMPGGTGPPP